MKKIAIIGLVTGVTLSLASQALVVVAPQFGVPALIIRTGAGGVLMATAIPASAKNKSSEGGYEEDMPKPGGKGGAFNEPNRGEHWWSNDDFDDQRDQSNWETGNTVLFKKPAVQAAVAVGLILDEGTTNQISLTALLQDLLAAGLYTEQEAQLIHEELSKVNGEVNLNQPESSGLSPITINFLRDAVGQISE